MGKENFPVLFIWGDLDKTVPQSCMVAAKQLVPRAEFLVLPDAGHLVFVEKEEETLKKILEVVKKGENLKVVN